MQEGEGRFIQRWNEDPGWRGRIGFITPPNFDIVPMEFLKIAPEGFASNEMSTYQVKDGAPAKFEWNVVGINDAVQQVEHCSMVLRAIGVDLIGQIGTPFAFCPEGGLAFTRDLQDRIEKNTGLPTVFMGLSVIKALEKMGCSSVAVACTYYSDAWSERYVEFLENAGFKMLGMENWVSQGFFPNEDEVKRHTVRRFHTSLVYKNARIVANRHPAADCVVISGGGVFTMDIIHALEMDLRKPVITSSAAFFWEIFCRLGVFEPLVGRGSLLASLAKGP